MISTKSLREYDALFIQASKAKDDYILDMNTHQGAILAFYLDHDGTSYSKENLDLWLEQGEDGDEFFGFYMSYIKQGENVCLYGDDSIFETSPEIPVCLPIKELKTLVIRWQELIEEYPPAITLHWEGEHPILTPWYNVDLSEYYGESPEEKK